MSTYLQLSYYVVFGRGDASDCCEWEELLTDEEEAIYRDAIKKELDLNEVEGLQLAVKRAYAAIEEQEISNYLDWDDEYVMECQGFNRVEPSELNRLVAEKDPHALEYFELQGLSDEELAKWDANDLDELPEVEEFYEDFEPCSPFDAGWDLRVNIVEPDYDEFGN